MVVSRVECGAAVLGIVLTRVHETDDATRLTQETCLQRRAQTVSAEDDVRRMMEHEDLVRQHTASLPVSSDQAGVVDQLRKALCCDPKVRSYGDTV